MLSRGLLLALQGLVEYFAPVLVVRRTPGDDFIQAAEATQTYIVLTQTTVAYARGWDWGI
jgi:hypothetical protein